MKWNYSPLVNLECLSSILSKNLIFGFEKCNRELNRYLPIKSFSVPNTTYLAFSEY